MKLELKHLCGYLPYGLKCELLNYRSDYVGEKYGIANGYYLFNNEPYFTFKDRSTAGKTVNIIKPILRPLSGLTEEHANNCNYSHKNFKWAIINKEVNVVIWNDLLKNHWDVFGLIESGLAIDKNTIK